MVCALPAVASDVPPGFSRVVILGSDGVELGDRVDVRSGEVVVNDAGAGELEVGKDVTTAAGWRLAGDRVEIKKGSQIGGDVAYNQLDNKGTILGSEITPLALPVFAPLPPFQTGTPTADDLRVKKGDSLSLPAGDYGALRVEKGGTVLFEGGVYSFAEIDADKESRLLFEDRSQVRIAGTLRTKKEAVVGPAPGASVDASQIIFYVAGADEDSDSGGDSGKKKGGDSDKGDSDKGDSDKGDSDKGDSDSGDSDSDVRFDRQNTVGANVYAPNGTIRIGEESRATGAFVGRRVRVDKEAIIALDSFFNEPPVAVDDAATVAEGGTVAILASGETSVLANDADPNGDALAVTTTPLSGPDHAASFSLAADGTFSYAHDGSETLSDAFVYEVCDDGTPVHCASATVAITITPINDPPAAADDAATTDEDVAVAIDVLANDADADGTLVPSSVAVLSAPSIGSTSVDVATGVVTYAPDADQNGSDSFVYEVCDDGSPLPSQCGTATVTVTINPVNDPPVADPQSLATRADAPLTITLTGSDVDGDALTFAIVSGPTTGQLSAITQTSAQSATVVFSLAAGDLDFQGLASFVFSVDDGNGGSDQATVEIDVEAANSPPVANDKSVQTGGQPSITINLSANDVDGDVLTFSIVSGPSAGVLTGLTPLPPNRASVVYTAANPAAQERDSFVFRVDDGNGGSDQGTVLINEDITETPNDPPILGADSIAVTTGGTATTLTSGAASLLDNDFDPNGDSLFVTTTPVSGPSNGSLTLAADGTFSYTHDGGGSSSDNFVYEVCDDGTPVECATARVFIRIRLPSVTVSVTKAGAGSGTVFSNPSGIDCGSTCSASFSGSSSIRLEARADDGSVFRGFSGDADCADGLLLPDGDKSCTATFEVAPPPPVGSFTVTVSKSGDGDGVVRSEPSGIDCGSTCAAQFPSLSRVRLEAVADDDSRFAGFAGDGDCLDGLLNGDGDRSCIAIFEALPPPPPVTVTLQVVVQGTGFGTISSNPPGINCGAACTLVVEPGETVTLFARPDDGRSFFAGFSGDPDCTDGVVTMDVDKVCIATFDSQ
ncbi:MAG: tandem-95 repeat protein [Acidobacteria bacterium]|nr:MAG: tandem-95 repeat protein [Acidobacteriota bacterium]